MFHAIALELTALKIESPSRKAYNVMFFARFACWHSPGPPEHAPHPRQQLAQIEGLDKVVVRADLKPDDPIDRLAFPRHDDDGDIVVLSEVSHERQTVFLGQTK